MAAQNRQHAERRTAILKNTKTPTPMFTKIKYTPVPTQVHLAWNTLKGEYTHTSRREPHPDFVAAMDALKGVVRTAVDLPENLCQDDDLVVRGVTLKDAADGDGEPVDGVCITALRSLDWCNAPLVINTPFSPVISVPTDGVDLEELLDTLETEANAYLNGKSAPGDLFTAETRLAA